MEFYRFKRKNEKGSRKVLVASILVYFLFWRVLYYITSDFRVYAVLSGIILVVLFVVNAYLAFGTTDYEKIEAKVICKSKVGRWRTLKVKFKACPPITLILAPLAALFVWTAWVMAGNLPFMTALLVFYTFLLMAFLLHLSHDAYIVTERGVAEPNTRAIIFWEEIKGVEFREGIILLSANKEGLCNLIPLEASEEILQILRGRGFS